MGAEPGKNAEQFDIDVSDSQTHMRGLDRERLSAIIERVLRAEGIARAEISLALVDNPSIHEINKRHLDHDFPTDVISFVLSEPDDETLSGDLVVSTEMAVDMARRDGIDAWTELVLYVIHGLLHICGHDDLTEAGAAEMRRREGELLAQEGLTHHFSPAQTQDETAGRERVSWPG